MKLSQIIMNKVFKQPTYQNQQGYSGFPMDHWVNFTSVAGYLLPIYTDILSPGDKVKIDTLIRSNTQPLSKPAMATCIERVEWFAVPIDQLYKPFSTKFYGISDVTSDLLPEANYNDNLPYVSEENLHNWLKSLPTEFDTTINEPVQPSFQEAKRLCDALGYTKFLGNDGSDPDDVYSFAGSVSALIPAAYQKIYYDHYRLTEWEPNRVKAYNLDSYNTNAGLNVNQIDRLNLLYKLHRRPYQLDYFTSMLPSPLVGPGSVGMAGVDLTKLNQWLTGLNSLMTGVPTSNSNSASNSGSVTGNNSKPTSVGMRRVVPTQTVANLQSAVADLSSQINPVNIRSMFAVEKLLQVTRRAKKHYDMQTLAHFGIDVPKGLSGECFKLGSFESYLTIGDVVATSDTTASGGSPLGTRAGVGRGNNSNNRRDDITFEAKCHCVLMAIYSVEPILNYINEGTMRINKMTSASDFYKPEFDNLGEQPVFASEITDIQFDSADPGNYDPNAVTGWIKRYQHLKAKYNRSFAGITTPFFQEWALNRRSLPYGIIGDRYFTVWPTDMNNILDLPYFGDEDYSTLYSQDYFINQVYFNVRKSSKMSVYGVPSL